MPKFRKKLVVIEAITFEELVEYGKANGADIVNGMPWSFHYNGYPITHENDDCYLIPTLEGVMRFERGDRLITGVNGEIYPCKSDIFAKTYEPADLCDHIGSKVFKTQVWNSVPRHYKAPWICSKCGVQGVDDVFNPNGYDPTPCSVNQVSYVDQYDRLRKQFEKDSVSPQTSARSEGRPS